MTALARAAVCIISLMTSAAQLVGQAVSVTVLTPGGTPVEGALVHFLANGVTGRTDAAGTARFGSALLPDALVAAALGFRPETVQVEAGTPEVIVRLTAVGVLLDPISVAGIVDELIDTRGGGIALSRRTILGTPSPVQADALRSLARVPGVSFSSPLSARPLVRGYESSLVPILLDDFEITNPYHIARAFSMLSADAIESAEVIATPTEPSLTGAPGGLVRIRGRLPPAGGGTSGGATVSLAEASAWYAANSPAEVLVSVRTGYLGSLSTIVTDGRVPYDLGELYARWRVPLGRVQWNVTAFGALDDYADLDKGSGMRWSNLLLGNRLRLHASRDLALDVRLSANRYALEATAIEVGSVRLNADNALRRVTGGVAIEKLVGAWRLTLGGELARRDASSVALGRTESLDATERTAFGTVAWDRGGFSFRTGLRVDATGVASVVQPMATLSVSSGMSHFALRFARSGRLYQTLTDPHPEPTIGFIDTWLAADDDTRPPVVNHLAATVAVTSAAGELTASAFASRGSGIGELRPADSGDPGDVRYRVGDSRTLGGELSWNRNLGNVALTTTYVISRSERRFDAADWVPWRLDRTHQLRADLSVGLADDWNLSVAGQVASGIPYTPALGLVYYRLPAVDGPNGPFRLWYDYAGEGSARSRPTASLDAAVRHRFGGPGRSHFTVGLTVTNLVFGPVAPDRLPHPAELPTLIQRGEAARGVPIEREFSLPPVPTVTVRWEF